MPLKLFIMFNLSNPDSVWSKKIHPYLITKAEQSLKDNNEISLTFLESIEIIKRRKFILFHENQSIPLYWFSKSDHLFFKTEIILPLSLPKAALLFMVSSDTSFIIFSIILTCKGNSSYNYHPFSSKFINDSILVNALVVFY